MLRYIIRRLLYAIPIFIGVNLITFTLFFVVNTPDDMARMHLGVKYVTPAAIDKWKQERGYDKPLLINSEENGLPKFTNTIFFEKSLAMFAFEFGHADDGRDIANEIKARNDAKFGNSIAGIHTWAICLHCICLVDGIFSCDIY